VQEVDLIVEVGLSIGEKTEDFPMKFLTAIEGKAITTGGQDQGDLRLSVQENL
jgi:hypothetical protein